MESPAQQPNKESVRLTKIAVLLMCLALVSQFTSFFLNNWKLARFRAPWNISDFSSNRFEIRATTIDSHGDPWFVAQKLFQDDSYELVHITKNHVYKWDSPTTTFDEMMAVSVAKDKTGNPWLILGKRLAHWDGTQWKFIPTPLNADIKDFTCPSVVIKDSTIWGIDNATKQARIIQLDLSHEPIQSLEILLPDNLSSQKYLFECLSPTSDNALIAVLSDDTQVDFYQLQNFEWRKITSFQKEQPSNLYVNDIAIDSSGRIWIVLNFWVEMQGRHIGKYDPKENIWTWFDVKEQPDLINRHFDYNHIAVDNLGRVWLSAEQSKLDEKIGTSSDNSYRHETHTVGVFEENPSGTLVEIRHYMPRNSYVETSLVSRMLVGSDKKIWTWHKQLVWMDSSQKELPQPLAKWFVTLTDHRIVIGIEILSLIFLVVVISIQIHSRRNKPMV